MSESVDTKVVGHGIDILETSRIQELVEQSGKQFEMECFTATERTMPALGAKRIEYLAGRFAAKKAVLKALGIEKNQDISWLDIEIQRLKSGEPSVALHGKCQDMAEKTRYYKVATEYQPHLILCCRKCDRPWRCPSGNRALRGARGDRFQGQ